MTTSGKHDLRLDILRVTAAAAVVWLHVSAEIVASRIVAADLGWWTANLADAATRWCVPLFVMASGALLLSQRAHEDPLRFYRRRLNRILVPTLFWTAVYAALRLTKGEAATAVLGSVAEGRPFTHLWYLYMVLGLYLITPMASAFVHHAPRRLLIGAVALSFLLAAVEMTVATLDGDWPARTFLGLWPYYLGYFTAGQILWRAPATWLSGRAALAVALACTCAVAGLTGLLLGDLGPRAWEVTYSYLDPLVVLMSLAIFNALRRVGVDRGPGARLAGVAHRLAPFTLGVYVVHPLWLFALDRAGLDGNTGGPILGIPATTAAALVLSFASARLLAALPFVRRTI